MGDSSLYGIPVIETEFLPDGEIRIVSVIKDTDSLELRAVALKGIGGVTDLISEETRAQALSNSGYPAPLFPERPWWRFW